MFMVMCCLMFLVREEMGFSADNKSQKSSEVIDR